MLLGLITQEKFDVKNQKKCKIPVRFCDLFSQFVSNSGILTEEEECRKHLDTMKKLIRDNVLKIEHYQPGLPLEVLKKELDFGREICKLASNENPLGPSSLAIDAVKKIFGRGPPLS